MGISTHQESFAFKEPCKQSYFCVQKPLTKEDKRLTKGEDFFKTSCLRLLCLLLILDFLGLKSETEKITNNFLMLFCSIFLKPNLSS